MWASVCTVLRKHCLQSFKDSSGWVLTEYQALCKGLGESYTDTPVYKTCYSSKKSNAVVC